MTESEKPITSNDRASRQISRNRRNFNRQIRILQRLSPGELAAWQAQRAATFAAYRHTGLFRSLKLEEFLDAIAHRAFPNEPNDEGTSEKRKSTLHILSRAYRTGGHTRVVEHWIASAPEDEIHSVVVTRRGSVTPRISEVVDARLGSTYKIRQSLSLLSRASEIRTLAREYSRVVLHVHMDDIVSYIAFAKLIHGTDVYIFNHADHRFWVGAGLPAQILEMRSWGQQLTLKTRGRADSVIVGLPFPSPRSKEKHADKIAARLKLGLPQDVKILLTIGSSSKFVSGQETDFPQAIKPLLKVDKNRLLITIGPESSHNDGWTRLAREYPGQVLNLRKMSSDKLATYILAADLGFDSFPMSGGMAVLDMISQGLPTLSLKCVTGHLDSVAESSFYCQTLDEWLIKAESVLNGRFVEPDGCFQSLHWHKTLSGNFGLVEQESETYQTRKSHPGPDVSELNKFLVATTNPLARFFF